MLPPIWMTVCFLGNPWLAETVLSCMHALILTNNNIEYGSHTNNTVLRLKLDSEIQRDAPNT